MFNMEKQKIRIRKIPMAKDGSIEIPKDLRKHLKLVAEKPLVLIEGVDEIIIRREYSPTKKKEKDSWENLSEAALESMWGSEDDIWDEIANGA